MWLAFLLFAAICPAGDVPVEIRALNTADLPLAGAEIREWSGQEPKERLLGVTDPDGRATVCVPRRAHSLGVYLTGFVPHRVRLTGNTDIAAVHLEPSCVTGTAPDGSFRMCSEDIRRLPFR